QTNRGLHQSGRGLDDALALLAKSLDAERHHVARLEIFRLGLHAHRHARRRAGDDHVARLHDKILRAAPDDVPAVKNHGAGVPALAFLAVHVEPHVEILRVLDLVLGNEPWSERAKRLATLTFGPLPRPLDLKDALRNIVGKAVARDDVESLLLA